MYLEKGRTRSRMAAMKESRCSTLSDFELAQIRAVNSQGKRSLCIEKCTIKNEPNKALGSVGQQKQVADLASPEITKEIAAGNSKYFSEYSTYFDDLSQIELGLGDEQLSDSGDSLSSEPSTARPSRSASVSSADCTLEHSSTNRIWAHIRKCSHSDGVTATMMLLTETEKEKMSSEGVVACYVTRNSDANDSNTHIGVVNNTHPPRLPIEDLVSGMSEAAKTIPQNDHQLENDNKQDETVGVVQVTIRTTYSICESPISESRMSLGEAVQVSGGQQTVSSTKTSLTTNGYEPASMEICTGTGEFSTSAMGVGVSALMEESLGPLYQILDAETPSIVVNSTDNSQGTAVASLAGNRLKKDDEEDGCVAVPHHAIQPFPTEPFIPCNTQFSGGGGSSEEKSIAVETDERKTECSDDEIVEGRVGTVITISLERIAAGNDLTPVSKVVREDKTPPNFNLIHNVTSKQEDVPIKQEIKTEPDDLATTGDASEEEILGGLIIPWSVEGEPEGRKDSSNHQSIRSLAVDTPLTHYSGPASQPSTLQKSSYECLPSVGPTNTSPIGGTNPSDLISTTRIDSPDTSSNKVNEVELPEEWGELGEHADYLHGGGLGFGVFFRPSYRSRELSDSVVDCAIMHEVAYMPYYSDGVGSDRVVVNNSPTSPHSRLMPVSTESTPVPSLPVPAGAEEITIGKISEEAVLQKTGAWGGFASKLRGFGQAAVNAFCAVDLTGLGHSYAGVEPSPLV